MWERIGPIIAELDAPTAPSARASVSDGRWKRSSFGCAVVARWNHLPQDPPDDSSAPRIFQRCIARGVFDRIWGDLVDAWAEWGRVDWEWQATDGAKGKACLGDLIGHNPTGRGNEA